MSLGQVALGLAGIALGVRQIAAGARRIGSVGGTKNTTARPVRRRSSHGGKNGLSDITMNTPSGPVRLRTYRIKNLDERIQHLRALVEQGKRDPAVYEFARRAVNKKCGNSWCVPEKNNLAEAKALFDAIRANVRYTSDIAGIDSYQKPSHTLKFRTADCDDFSTLACAAAATLGLPCRFKVIRTKGAPDWNHIFAQIGFPRRSPRKWVSFDASVAMPFGWEAPANMVDASRVFPL
jgi:transglutaminase-like putative cysteine protease